MLRVLDLFSCIGSHALGLQAAGGFETVLFCESNPWRRGILQRHFPGIPVATDVRALEVKHGTCDVIIGGPPCQKTSVAAAIHGKRSGRSLWPAMARIISSARPDWVVVEQPPGNASWEAAVARSLARARYHVARSEFSAADCGADYPRRRVFILAGASLPRLAFAWAAIPSEIDGIARAAAAGNPWHAGVPGTLRVADGVPCRMDDDGRAAARRSERSDRIEALGDSNPPVMATIIGRAILRAHAAGLP